MFDFIAESGAPYIMMHMQGPVTRMMENTKYDNLVLEISNYFEERLRMLAERDIKDIIIDPGFGFSKTLDQNYEILKNLSYFKALESPILVGVSRKSMIYKLLNTTPDQALLGTGVVNYIALEKGARILRVHDVKEAIETIKIYSKIN
jgi:dihydropteroate synthase